MTEVPVYPVEPVDRISRFSRLLARTPGWVAPLAVLGCAGAAIGYTLWADPAKADADGIPSCLVKLTTGLDCPGCGGTRAAWYLLHGDLPAAARHHLLFVFVVPLLVYSYVVWAGRVAFGWKLPSLRVSPAMLGWLLAAWGIFMVLRNLPWAPFTYFFV